MTQRLTRTWKAPGLAAVAVVVLPVLPVPMARADTATAMEWIDERQVRVRIVDAGPAGEGKHRLGFEIDLSEGWKTYWRHPGETGAAPQFNWDRSFNVAGVTPRFPAPTRFIDGDLVSFGYKTDVVLPLEVSLAKPGPALVRLDVMYAVCAHVCLPLQAGFELALNAKPDPRGAFLVERAMRTVPRKIPPPGLEDGVGIKPAENGVVIHIDVPMAGADAALIDVFAEGPGGWHLPPARPIAADGAARTFRLDLSGLPEDRRGSNAALRLTVVHPTGAFEQIVGLAETGLATE